MTMLTTDDFLNRPDPPSRFVKLESGEKAELVLLHSPMDESPIRERAFVRIQGQLCDYDEDLHRGLEVQRRYQVKVYSVTHGRLQILEQGPRVMKVLIGMAARQGWGQWVYELTRQGTGLRTQYSTIPIEPVSAELFETIQEALTAADFHLDPAKASEADAAGHASGEIPF